jgi:predicted  nucleic acid-binding Zn-ribbon protein
MRQVKSSLDVAVKRRFKTTNSLSKTAEESEHLESVGIDNLQTRQILARERERTVQLEASVERARQKMLKSREKLAGIINRNRALTNLRHEIQQERDQQKELPSLAKPSAKPEKSNYRSLRGIELKY